MLSIFRQRHKHLLHFSENEYFFDILDFCTAVELKPFTRKLL